MSSIMAALHFGSFKALETHEGMHLIDICSIEDRNIGEK